jgi:hypothetical protein
MAVVGMMVVGRPVVAVGNAVVASDGMLEGATVVGVGLGGFDGAVGGTVVALGTCSRADEGMAVFGVTVLGIAVLGVSVEGVRLLGAAVLGGAVNSTAVGMLDGATDGMSVVKVVGEVDGITDGSLVVSTEDGAFVGASVVGASVGSSDGASVSWAGNG